MKMNIWLGSRHAPQGDGFFGAGGDTLSAGAAGFGADGEGLFPAVRRAFQAPDETQFSALFRRQDANIENVVWADGGALGFALDRKSTRLNSSH